MKAIIKGGECVAIVFDTAGHDLTGCTVVDAVPEPVHDYVWNGSGFVLRPPTPAEETGAALEADVRWQALKTKSPAQIDDWLTANVTNVVDARRVLKVLLLAVQALARTR